MEPQPDLAGLDINLEIRLVESYRKFCNRIFNAVRLSLLKFDGNFIPAPASEVRDVFTCSRSAVLLMLCRKPRGEESLVELWILHKLNITAGEMNKQFAARDFKAATAAVYNFWSHDLLDVYLVSGSS
jgi:valyl-tRNA synthetase